MAKQVEVRKGTCRFCGNYFCKVKITLEDGRIVSQLRDEDDPRAARLPDFVKSCFRARAIPEWYYHPDRLRYPLKRVGERGEGKWQQVSWDQALDEIAAKIKEIISKYGPEAIATTSGTSRTTREYAVRFLNLLGSPNNDIGPTQDCFAPSIMISSTMFGFADVAPGVSKHSKVMMLIGTNPQQSIRAQWFLMREYIKDYGIKVIVVDPRRTATAEIADIHLQLRPGTDCALLMGMINVIISEELYDKDFVSKWCYGFDKLAERAKEYPLEKVAEITWVPAEKIREAARTYATQRPGVIYHLMGVEQLTNNIQTLQAKLSLVAICGNIDVKGGEEYRVGPYPDLVSEEELELNELLPEEQKVKQIGSERFKLSSKSAVEMLRKMSRQKYAIGYTSFAHAPLAYRAMLTGKPYPIRGVLTYQSNPMVTQTNTKLVYRALKSLDLYTVIDYWLTPSAAIADYVLPCAGWIERPNLDTFTDYADYVNVGLPIVPSTIPGKWDRRTDYEFFRGLGIRLGQEEYWPWKTPEEAMNYRLSRLGYTVEKLAREKKGFIMPPRKEERRYEKIGFNTPTGKVELFSTILEKMGYDPLPRYEEPPDSPISNPEMAREYPLILITGARVYPYFHSEHRQIESLRKRHPWPLIQIHPEKASELGIKNGDWVWIETPIGKCRQECQVFRGIHPEVVSAEHGWWYPELPAEEPWLCGVWESNINVVLDDDPGKCNKIYGSWPMRATLCKVYKAPAVWPEAFRLPK